MKTNKKVLLVTMALIVLSLGTAWCLFNDYKGKPRYIVNAYMKALNSRDYVSAASLFYEDERLNDFNDVEMAQYLSNYFEGKGFVKMEEGRGQIGEQTGNEAKAFYEVRYSFAEQNVTSTLSVVKVEDKWQVVFPFRIEDVNIYTPLGSTVWFNDEPVTQKENNKYIVKNVLPGHYTVRIAFPNEICSDYITDIEVPTQTEIKIPYQTVGVHIETIPGTIVELGGEKQANWEGSVDFEQVLEGTYPLKIYDIYGNIETYESEITISNEKKQFVIEDFKLSKTGSERFNQSINTFYAAYIKGIKGHNSKTLENHVVSESRESIIGEFEDWFIKNKDVQNAQMEVELEQVEVTENGDLEASVLEIVHLTNKEVNDTGKMQNVGYKIALKWVMTLSIDGEEYKLKDRVLEESLVSYKDKDGKWVAY
ncbi:MAG: hypothetical protein ACLSH8_08935 [Zhenhengia sp.]|uniref:hypothetical protein n=1 Tax=Zhenhengia sp. TaxID=2944208 RepID=UPI0039920ACC